MINESLSNLLAQSPELGLGEEFSTRSLPVDFLKEGRLQAQLNVSHAVTEYLKTEEASRRDSLYVVLPVTIIYVAIFFTGVIGNVSTCVVIARNRSMHTATNYYLFSLAISDLLLLISGLPPEMYYIWSHFPYVFGEVFCIIQGFAAETSANATVLTITAFTVERYVAICHPFISHTMSKLSRAVKFVVAIWLLALCLAIPQAIQFGVVYNYDRNGTAIEDSARCTVKWEILAHAFETSTLLFFAVPMTIITVLYVLIGIKLRKSKLLTAVKRNSVNNSLNHSEYSRRKCAAQRNVIRMLVAVVVAFFICWAPFHAQRLLAVYAQGSGTPHPGLIIVYTTLTYISGVLYYLSTTVNPLLYSIMSNKFREAFKSMLSQHCGGRSSQKGSPRRPTYSALSHYPRSTIRRTNQLSASISVSDETQRLAPTNSPKSVAEEQPVVKDQERKDPPEGTPATKESTPRENRNHRSRGSSNSSQVTVMTSVSKGGSEGNNNVGGACINDCLPKSHRPGKTVTLGILAERLRMGTRGFFAQQQKSPRPRVTPEVASAPPKLQSHPSIDSANTISNSSLQDLDETEFTGSELAKYMGELNFDLVT
ncbi:pyrokinin-1 receptor-like [Orussus abietinus]|uniref:pyrokinin-1 receptor-like n=1 Tax=Orussus abietinus TaxID=222816 RepID=UPI0006261076|nr:pyrokinin-1 receptor-like [Orussus abietinus]